jgi:predicted Zn-dependent peptidase
LASQLPFYSVMYGDWRVMFTGLKDIEKVSAEDVQRVAKQYFNDEYRTTVNTVKPKDGAQEASK